MHSSARTAVLRTALIGLIWLCGYGYGADQDPFVLGFKQLAAAANGGRWSEARAALETLSPSLAEIRAGLGRDARAPLERALEARDSAALAEALLGVAQLAIALKFESSRREQLGEYYAAKYRVESARSYYAELLAPAVRRRDPSGGGIHERIWGRFDAAREALGGPGFLGRGSVPPDLAAFTAAARGLDADLREVFPFLEEVIR